MNFSKIHFELSKNLNERKVLTDPQEFLGPDWEKVLEFWWVIESLSKDEMKKIRERFRALNRVAPLSTKCANYNASKKVVGHKVNEQAWFTPFYMFHNKIIKDFVFYICN